MATMSSLSEMTAPVPRIAVEELGLHLATLEEELKATGTIELVRGDKVVAELRSRVDASPLARKERVIPDFMGQMREAFGDQVFPDGTTLQWVQEDRGE